MDSGDTVVGNVGHGSVGGVGGDMGIFYNRGVVLMLVSDSQRLCFIWHHW